LAAGSLAPGLLAAGIAHEVGNPLTGISSIVQMLRRRDLDGYTQQKLELVGDQLQRIQGIVRELVTFGRPSSGASERLVLAEIVAEAMSIAKYYKGGRSRSIEVAIPPDLPIILGVRGQLVSVILNLVLNAIDATCKGGRIEIAATCEADRVVISVSDDGAGLEPHERAKLFQPYFTTKPRGTGLGLYMSRQLLAMHGGTIECAATSPEGTRFVVELPAQAERVASKRREAVAPLV
jgi:signal transduction histidine kinase